MLVVLVVCIVIVALAVYEVLARVDEHRRSVVASLTLALLATAPRFFGSPFESIALGLVVLALLCSFPAWLGLRRLALSGVIDEPPDVGFRLVFLVVFALGAWIEIGARLWDGDFGHFGFSSSIARGVLPPEHPLFPGEPLRYHVGFDVLVALLVRSGVAVGAAVHVVSLALLALLLFVARDVGRLIGLRAGGVLTAALVLLGYGPTAMCLADGWAATAPSLAFCSEPFPRAWVSAQSMPPTVFSSFFQHPQGLAMPIALALLLLACSVPTFARTLLCAFGLVLLAHCQVVYFACAGLGIGAAIAFSYLVRGRVGFAIQHSTVLLIAAAIAFKTSDIAGGANELTFGRGYFSEPPVMVALHQLAVFGPTLVAVFVVLVRLFIRPVERVAMIVALVVASAAGFAVASTFTYARSWDIVKFFAVGAFFANVLLAYLLARLWYQQRALTIAVTAVCAASALFWGVRSGVLNGVVAPYYALAPPSPLGAELLRVAGDDIAPRDVILTDHAGVDIWHHGFHVVGADHRRLAKGQLIDTARAEERARVARRALRTLDAEDLRALSVDWLLLPRSRTVSASLLHKHADVADHVLYRVTP